MVQVIQTFWFTTLFSNEFYTIDTISARVRERVNIILSVRLKEQPVSVFPSDFHRTFYRPLQYALYLTTNTFLPWPYCDESGITLKQLPMHVENTPL